MSSSEESDSDNTLKNCSLPRKSKHKYMFAYEYFMRWKNKRNENNLDENVFLEYFTELAKIKKPSTLWSQYSMLKATMLPKQGVDMKNFLKLLSYLRKFTIGFKSEKSKILTEDDIQKFVHEAPDDIYLVAKVALIIGVGGACKIYELTNLTVNDINMHGDLMLVRILQAKKDRTFIVKEQFVPTVKKYQALRPKKMPTKRFFINYRAGVCTRQVIGRNKLSSFPKQIASYLKLPNPERYTGMCFKASWISSKTSLMIVEKRKVVAEGAKNKDENSLLTTLVNREDTSFVDVESTNGIDIKIEEMDTFEEESLLRDNRVQEEFANDFRLPSYRGLSSDVLDISEDTYENIDTIRLKDEEGDRIINQRNESQSENEPRETNINVAGKNIKISFKNCAHVGNITINVMNKK